MLLIKITEEEAILQQKLAAAQTGHVYDDDKEALADFMTIHWAW
jgi:hypothetical protein